MLQFISFVIVELFLKNSALFVNCMLVCTKFFTNFLLNFYLLAIGAIFSC